MNQEQQVQAIFDRVSMLGAAQRLAVGITILSVEATELAAVDEKFDSVMRMKFGPNWKDDEKSHFAAAAMFLHYLISLAENKKAAAEA